MPIESDMILFGDKEEQGEWRVEYHDNDGTRRLIIFIGPGAEQRARDYHAALQNEATLAKLKSAGPERRKTRSQPHAGTSKRGGG